MSSLAAARPRLVPALVTAGLALAAGAYVATNDPASGAAFIPCPFHELTGLWCPGCGMTRGFHHLLTGDVRAALSSNLLLPVVVVLAGWGWLAWWRPTVPRLTAVPTWVWPTLAATALAFGVLRNLPVDGLRSLAP